jgi:phosphate transport system protein
MPPNNFFRSRSSLDRDLMALRDNVLRLSSLVDVAIQQSLRALRYQDIGLAHQIVDDDARINRLRYQIEEDAYQLIARQQPTARDLRGIIASIHIAIELERIGDYASGIATLVIQMSNDAVLKPLVDIPRMVDISRQMLRSALNAYLHWDEDQARKTIARDQEIDVLDDRVYHELIDVMVDDKSKIGRATFMLWISHNIERIGDRITNICERTIYMVTGEIYQGRSLRALHDADIDDEDDED